jgi:type 1 glutamine amidotransferase
MASTKSLNVLLFSKTAGYRHESIAAGTKALQDLAEKTGNFTITASEDAEATFTPASLSQFQVIVLLHTSGTFLSPSQLHALQEYIRSGGGVLAIHGAAAGMPSCNWYGKLIGAHFDMHPDPEPGSLLVSSSSHPIINNETPPEKWMDEWYNFTSHPSENSNLHILLRGNTKTFKGGKHGNDHPLVWCQEFEGGRSVYIALGHFNDPYADNWFLGMVERGILWAARQKDEKE